MSSQQTLVTPLSHNIGQVVKPRLLSALMKIKLKNEKKKYFFFRSPEVPRPPPNPLAAQMTFFSPKFLFNILIESNS